MCEIFEENVDESPFHIGYNLRTVFFSKEVISLFGEISVYNHMPHGWGYYEGKTLYKKDGEIKEITLADLFTTPNQREFLRAFCENNLKNRNEQHSYFSGQEPLYTTLAAKDIHTFVIDDKQLIIIFQPYSVGGCGDGPFIVKIPYSILKDHWNPDNPLAPLLEKIISSKMYTSSWNEAEFFAQCEEGLQFGDRP